ncbi:Uma2 family endonuclease [Nocardiopsis sediminis]|uniref:Uma2 family endonuclease n=1 Tax=Nocardiopsis sediminis TaxID=1778267 RepID=A0ABV8FIB0_9ACTN
MSIGRTTPHQRLLTVDDLERMPDDGNRYELVDGRLDVSPSPATRHTLIQNLLVTHIGLTAIRQGYVALTDPGITFNADRTHHRRPDVAVVRTQDIEHPNLTRPPVLAVEVVSPSSTHRDYWIKRREYADFGIESYWIISPSPDKTGLLELRLEDGEYHEVTQVYGEEVFETDTPFPIKLVPQWLVADGAWTEHIGGE